MQEIPVRFLDREDPLEEDMASHASILAWRIPGTEEPGGLHPRGHTESDTTEGLSTAQHEESPPSLAMHPELLNLHSFQREPAEGKSFTPNTHPCMRAKLPQLCPTLCSPENCSPPDSSVCGILQARLLERVAVPFLTRGLNPRLLCLLHCQAGSYLSCHLGSPKPPSTRLIFIESLHSAKYSSEPQRNKSWKNQVPEASGLMGKTSKRGLSMPWDKYNDALPGTGGSERMDAD